MRLTVKTCGLNDPESVSTAMQAGADFAGFVLYPPSPRAVSPKEAAELAAMLPEDIHAVAVVVDMTDVQLEDMLAIFRPAFIQLHGKETPERVVEIKQKFGIQVIKAIAVGEPSDVFSLMQYIPVADRLLIDAKPSPSATLPGGNGEVFDWSILQGVEIPLRWFLSGGLTVDNLAEAVHSTGAQAVDASSSLESGPGYKDPALIQAFVEAAKKIDV